LDPVLSILALALCISQETRPAPASAPVPRDPAVDDVVERAKRFQFPGGSEVEIRAFKIVFDFVVRGEDGTHEFRATHIFREPDRILTILDDDLTRVRTQSGFDGARYWQREGGKVTVFLEGREFRRDREEIDERVRLSSDLAGAFSVPRLLARVRKLRRGPDEERDGRKVAVLEGETDAFGPLRAAEAQMFAIRLLFDAETGALLEATSSPIGGSADGLGLERFRFEAPKDVAGIHIPHRIRVYEGDARAPRFEINIRQIEVNPGVGEEVFRPPK
jgi:hypothetical protein